MKYTRSLSTALSTTAAVLLSLATPATAGDMGNVQVYGGLQGGGVFSKSKFKTDSFSAAAPAGTVRLNTSTTDKAFMGGVFLGVRYPLNAYFVGLEAEWNFDGLNAKVQPLDSRPASPWVIEMKRRYQGVASLVAGWKYNEVVTLYGKLGAGYARFSMNEGRGQRSNNTVTTSIVSFIPALGVEYEVHKNAAVRLEVAGDVFGRDIKGNSVFSANLNQSTKASYQSVSVKFGVLAKI